MKSARKVAGISIQVAGFVMAIAGSVGLRAMAEDFIDYVLYFGLLTLGVVVVIAAPRFRPSRPRKGRPGP